MEATKKIIVLETSGKGDDVDNVKITLFDDQKTADAYCKSVTDKNRDEKYWRYAEIIREKETYEMARYKNY